MRLITLIVKTLSLELVKRKVRGAAKIIAFMAFNQLNQITKVKKDRKSTPSL